MKSSLFLSSVGFAALSSGLLQGVAWAEDTVIAASASETLTISWVIKNEKEKLLEQRARAVSDPQSPSYQKFLTYEEINRKYRPKASRIQYVAKVLKSYGLSPKVHASGLFIDTPITVGQVESLASVSLSSHQESGRPSYLTPDKVPTIPPELRGAVEGIGGLDQTPWRSHMTPARTISSSELVAKALAADLPPHPDYNSGRANTGTPAGCPDALETKGYTPNQWLHAYGLDQLQGMGYQGQGERIAFIEIDGFYQPNLDAFTDCFGLPRQQLTLHTYPAGAQPIDPFGGLGNGETMLDVEIVTAIAPEAQLDIWQDTENNGESAGQMMLAILAQPKKDLPTIISNSTGLNDTQNYYDLNQVNEMAYRRAAAMGISIFVASGDQGATDVAIHIHIGGVTNAAPVYAADYPSSSPWATAVGGTNLVLDAENNIVQEIVWNNWTFAGNLIGDDYPLFDIWAGGGGVSRWFNMPSWQKKTLNKDDRFRWGSKPARLLPDVALLADNQPGIVIIEGNQSVRHPGGTSAAAPEMAGGVALINSALRGKGKKRVGFMNPLLYRLGKHKGSLYTDVTTGNIDTMWQTWGLNWTEIATYQPSEAFTARAGWDAATGWGSPKFPQLLDELLKRK